MSKEVSLSPLPASQLKNFLKDSGVYYLSAGDSGPCYKVPEVVRRDLNLGNASLDSVYPMV